MKKFGEIQSDGTVSEDSEEPETERQILDKTSKASVKSMNSMKKKSNSSAPTLKPNGIYHSLLKEILAVAVEVQTDKLLNRLKGFKDNNGLNKQLELKNTIAKVRSKLNLLESSLCIDIDVPEPQDDAMFSLTKLNSTESSNPISTKMFKCGTCERTLTNTSGSRCFHRKKYGCDIPHQRNRKDNTAQKLKCDSCLHTIHNTAKSRQYHRKTYGCNIPKLSGSNLDGNTDTQTDPSHLVEI